MSVSSHTSRAIRVLAPWILLVPLLACGLLDQEPEAEPAQEETTAAPSAPAEATPAAEGSGGACSRIAACCRAYIAAMGGSVPASTCDAYNNVAHIPEATCESTMAGYRSGLSAMNKAIPSECQ